MLNDDPTTPDDVQTKQVENSDKAETDFRTVMAQIAERAQRLRAKFAGVDVVTLDDNDWREWLSVHHWHERDAAKGRRAQHRHAMKMEAKATGQPWKRNDPRARHFAK